MLIRNTRFNLVFPKVDHLRRKAFEIEERLAHYFSPITLVPIPDEAPEEIPRISTSSHNGHSNLNISLNNAQLFTSYDEKYQDNWKECLDYLVERVNEVSGVIDSYVEGNFLFSGLTTEIVINVGEDPINLIKSQFLNLKSNVEPHDINYKITFVIEEKYYVNITINNLRVYEGLVGDGPIQLSSLKEKEHTLGLTIDINDRYAHNFNPKHTSSIHEIKKIFDLTDKVISQSISKILSEGVFEL